MSSLFSSLANELSEASKRVTKALEEGSDILFGQQESHDHRSSDRNSDRWEDGSEQYLEVASPLEGMAEGVIEDIMKRQVGPQSTWEHVEAFCSAIQWTEPFVVALLALHLLLFVATVIVVRREALTPRVILLVVIATTVYSSQWLNLYGAKHWRGFATQNYFDTHGVFVSIMLCAPLLLNSFVMLIAFLREASKLLVQVKKFELKKTRRPRRHDKNTPTSSEEEETPNERGDKTDIDNQKKEN